jgi:ATP-dependent DNA helicase PIF1
MTPSTTYDNSIFQKTIDLVSEKKSILVSGEAGTGKSTLMKRVCTHLCKNPLLNVHVTAPTGVAAVNAGGTTLHAWLGLGLGDRDAFYYLKRLDKYPVMVEHISRTTHLIIDEISMVSPHMFSLIHSLCCHIRKDKRSAKGKPFGGMILLLFGDFCQLKSIKRSLNKHTNSQSSMSTYLSSPTNNGKIDPSEFQFVFETEAWTKLDVRRIWLRHNYRQGNDLDYATLLNRIRMGKVTANDIRTLRTRVVYRLPQKEVQLDPQGRVEVMTPVLTTHKHGVVEYNQEMLSIVSHKFSKQVYTYHPDIQYKPRTGTRDLTPTQLSTETERLQDRFPVFNTRLCVNAQVMMRCNSMMKEYGIVNGTIGIVRFLSDKLLKVSFQVNGIMTKPLSVSKHQFHMKMTNGIMYMKQFPLSLAYSCTIHKSQSVSLDRAIIDIKHCFEESMVYVALSRVRTLNGLQIRGMFDSRWFLPNKLALTFETDPLVTLRKKLITEHVCEDVVKVVLSYWND